jgi:hypothetical protein
MSWRSWQKTIPNPSPHVTTQLVVHPQVIGKMDRWTFLEARSIAIVTIHQGHV